jgi:xylulokinase
MAPVLAFDVGASAVKAGLIAEGGRTLALASVACPVALAPNGAAEIDPEAWWQAVSAAAAAALRQAGLAPDRVLGIAGTGMTRTQIVVDAEGRALGPALTWLDRRASEDARRLARIAPADAEPWTAYHPLARLLWLARARRRGAAAAIIEPKDFVVARLTGRLVRDAVSAYRTDRALARMARGRSTRSPWTFDLLPRAAPPHAVAGAVLPGLGAPFDRLVGKPVAVGSQDTWCAALGLGVVAAGQGYLVSGTSEALGWLSKERRRAPGLLCIPWLDGLRQTGGPSHLGVAALAWWQKVAPGAKAAQPQSARLPLFLPFLAGARLPYWDSALRGALLGLDLAHGPGDLAAAVAAGVALLNRDVFDRATGGRLGRLSEIRIGGGAARDDGWCQIKADVIGRPVRRMAAEEPGLVGAAMALRRALDRRWRYAAEAAALESGRLFAPDSTVGPEYDRLLPVFRRACAGAAELSKAWRESGEGA